jgi:hypothetical protein
MERHYLPAGYRVHSSFALSVCWEFIYKGQKTRGQEISYTLEFIMAGDLGLEPRTFGSGAK